MKTMKMIGLVALCGLTAITVGQAEARPVSYPGGWTLMQTNDGDMNGVHVHYSPTAKYSVGYKGEYWREGEWQFHGAQLNYLMKRWNNPDSQANFYLKSGAGIAYSDKDAFDHETEGAGFTGVALDWEDRRYFASYENRYTYAGDISKFYMQKARVGVAPYIGDYGDLHTWLMLQVDHVPEKDDPVTVTPLVRFFKGEYLAELGMNNHGEALFNLIIRY